MDRIFEIVNIFEKAASSYNEWYRKPMGVYAFQSELKGLESVIPHSGIGCDIGAGTGIFAKNLLREERIVLCLDLSSMMLKEAKKENLPSILAPIEALPLRTRSLDFAYMITVIEFLTNPIKALLSIRYALKHDAPLIIEFINRDSPWGEMYSKKAEEADPIFRNARLYTLKEICLLLDRAGYVTLDILGTLTSPPDKPSERIDLTSVGSNSGVIIIKAKNSSVIKE
jgi:ubiquinone/menaquinone biosynthesis C-methylase UbiE